MLCEQSSDNIYDVVVPPASTCFVNIETEGKSMIEIDSSYTKVLAEVVDVRGVVACAANEGTKIRIDDCQLEEGMRLLFSQSTSSNTKVRYRITTDNNLSEGLLYGFLLAVVIGAILFGIARYYKRRNRIPAVPEEEVELTVIEQPKN